MSESVRFELRAPFVPSGDQEPAIEKLCATLEKNAKWQVLLGVTGSGKTFTMANIIARLGRPALVISHNKTLAAQLYGEFREFFPKNRVRYFVSYYDYYQPEAYLPATDTYIEKDAAINEDIDRLRLAATSAILSSRDVVVVASVSAIYPLGSPVDHREMMLQLTRGDRIARNDLLRKLVGIQYERNQFELTRSSFRVRGNYIEIVPSYEEHGLRIAILGGSIGLIESFDLLTGNKIADHREVAIYPAKHFVTPREKLVKAAESITAEMEETVRRFQSAGKPLEAERIETRTKNDMEMLLELGYCHGIENYSRHLAGRERGERPECLLDYFPSDYLLFVDESHMTLPQIRGMYHGDRSRKETLVEFGFRLSSALDNRPLMFEEFESILPQVVCVSATPGSYELEKCGVRRFGESSPFVAEQIIRPTGLLDPMIEVRPVTGQLEDLIDRIRERIKIKERSLVLTITTNLAEELTDFLKEYKIRCMYLHYEIETLERMEILKNLREAKFDVLVGINLLREGLDLPEVSFVAILDADKEGFLRSERSLIQIMGRASRSINGLVVMYADTITPSMKGAIEETERRRKVQDAYNRAHHITPRPVSRPIGKTLAEIIGAKKKGKEKEIILEEEALYGKNVASTLKRLEKKMMASAKQLDFEKAIHYRDRITRLKKEG
ncbi:MAG: excinuclease ABC subunit UvrB [Candidatus Ratteibacteria bacterium]